MTTDKETVRAAALRAVQAILEEGSLGHKVIARELSLHPSWSGSERAFFTRLTEGTAERSLELDYVIDQFSRTPVQKMKPAIRGILRTGVYQLLYMDAVPDRAACDEAVRLAKKRGLAGLSGFVNGVMRAIAAGKDGRTYPPADTPEGMSVRYSMPVWIVEKWLALYGRPVTEKMLGAMLAERPLCVHMNRSKAEKQEIIESLEKQGVSAKVHPYSSQALTLEGGGRPDSLEAFRKGWIQVQDISSQLASSLAARALKEAAAMHGGELLVLDTCAAPGGKSVYLADAAALLGRPAVVVSRDLSAGKVRQIEENRERTGLAAIVPQIWDAKEFCPDNEEKADVVIADLPCSGLGIMGRKKDIRCHVRPEGLAELAGLQREILSVVHRYVRPGGFLIYSTCTINPEENEENARWFAGNFPFRLRRAKEWLEAGAPETGDYLQLLPGVHESDGFFAAVFERTGGEG